MAILKFGNTAVVPAFKNRQSTNIEAFIGEPDANGVLQAPDSDANIVLDGVTDLVERALYFKFYGATLNSISAPDLVGSNNSTNGSTSMYGLCQNGTITSASFPKLDYVRANGMTRAFQDSTLSSINLKAKSVDNNGLQYAFSGCTNLTGAMDFSGIESSGDNGLQYMLQNCTGITSLDLSSLGSVGTNGMSYMCTGCTNLKTVNLSSLFNVGSSGMYQAFYNCVNLESVDFSYLQSLNIQSEMSQCFAVSSANSASANKLKVVRFPLLAYLRGSTVFNQCFRYRTGLEHIYFPALNSMSFGSNTNQFNSMLQNVTGCTVHFPYNLENVIGSWTSVTQGFGGTNTTVLFDLPLSEGVSATFRIFPTDPDNFENEFDGLTMDGFTHSASEFKYMDSFESKYYYLNLFVKQSTATPWSLATKAGYTASPASGTLNIAGGTTININLSAT